ncbi:MAG: radical SAM family heme chaperone HemW [Candidatus Nanopelagicales bacterium]
MAGLPPPGDPLPRDGALPSAALARLPDRAFGLYLHIPFCTTRCGYCDFNTYTATELLGDGQVVRRESFHEALLGELELAARVLGPHRPPVSTVFFGGGTPTLLASSQFAVVMEGIERLFGLAADAEVTAEANPETIDESRLAELRAAGINRLSLGMQSATPHVLRTLDRVHTPGAALAMVGAARAAGFASVSLDLIYGTPGETLADWRETLEQVIAVGPDHVSAYALIVERGTRLAAAVRRGNIVAPDDDHMAAEYELADELLSSAGLNWYELSNWSRTGHECRHNLAYWRGDNWWGVGPGAHSHVGGVRWWNVRHPAAYTSRLAEGLSPGQAREILSASELELERTMLQVRLSSGLLLNDAQREAAAGLAQAGLGAVTGDRLVLTRRGRLLADVVTRALSP